MEVIPNGLEISMTKDYDSSLFFFWGTMTYPGTAHSVLRFINGRSLERNNLTWDPKNLGWWHNGGPTKNYDKIIMYVECEAPKAKLGGVPISVHKMVR